MGIYLNPGNENFRSILSADIYVDKSMMISVTNAFIDKGNKYICVSRPRRFGKTIAGNMLCAYYSKGCDSADIFGNLKISNAPGYEEKRNRYNVIKIDINSEYQNSRKKEALIERLTDDINQELLEAFPEARVNIEDSIAQNILKIHKATSETFILIIDEYDILVREKVERDLFDLYLSFLNGLFKSDTLRPAISLAYLTGILPIVRDKVQSKLNNFEEFTMLNAGVFSEFLGFTRDEVSDLCERYDMDFEECRRWYDGYELYYYDKDKKNTIIYEVYNPESAVKSVLSHEFENYWGRTSSYEAITDRIEQNFEGTKEDVIKMLSGEKIDVNVTRYLNTMDSFSGRSDVFTCLIHLGYLAYDRRDKTCRIPNWEIRQEWYNAIEAMDEYKETNRIIDSSKELFIKTLEGDEEAVGKALDKTHIHVYSNRSYNNEDVLQSAIYLAYIYALNEYTCVKEMTAGKGFADMTYIPVNKGRPALIIELKHNKTPESALDQIHKKQYFESLLYYEGNLIFVGINYDEKEKTHQCRIERFLKK